jgi:tRNA G37 N-methylase Trm5
MTQENNKNKRGAPLGNQNARTHGFYSKRLSRKQQKVLESASNLSGVDQEIAIVRMKIEDILSTSPQSYDALMLAVSVLVKLLKAKQMLHKDNPNVLSEIMAGTMREMIVPLGLWPAYLESGDIALVKIKEPPAPEDIARIWMTKEELDEAGVEE